MSRASGRWSETLPLSRTQPSLSHYTLYVNAHFTLTHSARTFSQAVGLAHPGCAAQGRATFRLGRRRQVRHALPRPRCEPSRRSAIARPPHRTGPGGSQLRVRPPAAPRIHPDSARRPPRPHVRRHRHPARTARCPRFRAPTLVDARGQHHRSIAIRSLQRARLAHRRHHGSRPVALARGIVRCRSRGSWPKPRPRPGNGGGHDRV